MASDEPKLISQQMQEVFGISTLRNGAKPVNLELVKRAAGIGCTVGEVATLCGVTEMALHKRMEDYPAIREAFDDGRNEGRETLRRMQWAAAETGNPTMLIWLGKQLLGQRDKNDVEHTGKDGEPLIPLLNLTINRD